jgi:hypothetical protein
MSDPPRPAPGGAAVKAYLGEREIGTAAIESPVSRSDAFSVEQADPDPRPWRDVGIKRGAAISVSGHSGRRLPSRRFLTACGIDHIFCGCREMARSPWQMSALRRSIVCEPCKRRGRYSVARLIDEHGGRQID